MVLNNLCESLSGHRTDAVALESRIINSNNLTPANVEVYLNNPVGIVEHSNIVESIEQELDMIAKYQDQIDIINKYFKK